MMNGEGPSVPITTLAGIQSLTDLLLELPLPTPIPGTTSSNRSLLCHLRDTEEARRVLNEGYLVPNLIEALAHTKTDHVEVKDGYLGGPASVSQHSQLMQLLLARNPNIFNCVPAAAPPNVGGHVGTSQWGMQPQFPSTSLYPQQPSYSPSSLSSCSPHPNSPQFTSQGSPGYYQPDPSQSSRHVQNAPLPMPQQKSPASLYNQYPPPHNVAQTEKYPPAPTPTNLVHINAVSPTREHPNLVGSGLVENQPYYGSTTAPKYTDSPGSQSYVHSFPNGCGDTVNLISPVKCNNSRTVLVDNQPLPVNSDSSHSHCSLLTPPGQPEPSPSTSQTPLLSSNNISHGAPIESVDIASKMQPEAVVPPLSSDASLAGKVQHHGDVKSNNEFFSKVTPKSESMPSSESQAFPGRADGDTRRKSIDKLDSNKGDCQAKKKSIAGPVVVLNKLSLEEQALAQKSVREFTIKSSLKSPRSASPEDMFFPKHTKSKSIDGASKVTMRRRSSGSEITEMAEKAASAQKKKNKERERRSSGRDSDTKSQKRHAILDLEDDFAPGKTMRDYESSLTERVKKRRRTHQQAKYAESPTSDNDNEEEEDNDSDYREASPLPQSSPRMKEKKPKIKRIKKEIANDPISAEDFMDTSTYQRFARTVDSIFDAMEDLDLTAELDEDAACPPEALIPVSQLKELCNEAAKVKRLHAMNQFPPERLVRLLNILERNILDGAKILPVQSHDEQDEEESRLWLELTMERVIRSSDASLTALYIMTSRNMPEKVFLEEIIEKIVMFVKFQLQNTVYPVFDPAYRIDPKSKDGYAGSIKQKRAHAQKVKEKSIVQLYNKLHETVGLLAELLEVQMLTDTIILQVSTLGVSPFFVEGVSELQLSALRLVTTVFAKYDKHRQLILEDILASIARLPTSKRSLRNYRLNSEEQIQMLTALVLQLIHSVIRLPEIESEKPLDAIVDDEGDRKKDRPKETQPVDKDVLLITSYESAVCTAVNFLSVFLKKCGTKNEEMDYRPLFEFFVQDLLSTVNKPEWPASELLLSLLGRLLVQNFSNKSLDMTLRVASLEYLGVVAARLRRDAVTSQLHKETIKEMVKQIVGDNVQDDEISPNKGKKSKHKSHKPSKTDDTQVLQKALLQYLDANVHSDPALQFSRKFYIAQWYRDATAEISRRYSKENDKEKEQAKEKEKDNDPSQSPPKTYARSGKHRKSRRPSQANSEYENDDDEKSEKDEPKVNESGDKSAQVLALIEERKRFLLSVIKPDVSTHSSLKQEKNIIDYNTAESISRFLASRRPFSQSFDIYLSQILRVLNETAVAVRTKAMKCLTLVVEADPGILARPDMQTGVHNRLLDQSTSVREAAVDLVGKFILIRPELTHKYYNMLTARILDTGVSVRKRVIKILKDICLEQPDFPKIPEICVKIIRRVNDEEGIKKLVGEVFQSMWFTPISDRESGRILQKVKNITHVVAACKDIGLEWFEQLLTNLLKNKEDSNYKAVLKSCKQIVDCLVENVLCLEETSMNGEGSGASQNLVACLTTLYLFSKIQPPLVVPHAMTIQPYLTMKCSTQTDYMVLQNVTRTLELVIPLMEHPSESFLAQVEEDVVKLILRHGMIILPSCVSCIGAVVNRVTHNYELVRDTFHKFFVVLLGFKRQREENPDDPNLVQQRPKLLRSLITIGLFCKHFDLDAIEAGCSSTSGGEPMKDRVFEVMLYFTKHECDDIRFRALTGLGFMMIRHYEFMLGPEVKALYHELLSNEHASPAMKCQVLKNLTAYLLEEEQRMIQKDMEWSKVSKKEDLKEMCDVSSGMASTIIQVYLKQILECVLNQSVAVRKAALHVIQLVQGQGLIHPVQIVPYLICMGSDDEQMIRTKADQLLQEIEKKYPGFVQMKALPGVRLSYKMQQTISNSNGELLRGFRMTDQQPSSRNGFLFSVVRGTRQNRRAFLLSLLKLFDEQARTPLTELLYIADNIVYFPYQVQDEPLFIIHHIDVILSVSGSNLLQSFREGLLPIHRQVPEGQHQLHMDGQQQQHHQQQQQLSQDDDDDDEDDCEDAIYSRLPEDTSFLQECMTASQGCMLLLFVKQTLKEMYGFTDNKIQQYSPNEAAKVYEKNLNRKPHVRFKPTAVIDVIKSSKEGPLDEEGRRKLVQQYLDFKQLMMTIDPADDDDDDDDTTRHLSNRGVPALNTSSASTEQDGASVMTTTPVVADSSANSAKQECGSPGMASFRSPDRVKDMTSSSTLKSSKLASGSSSSSHRVRSKSKTPKSSSSTSSSSKDKVKKKHRKKRRRILGSDESNDDDDSDPDYYE